MRSLLPRDRRRHSAMSVAHWVTGLLLAPMVVVHVLRWSALARASLSMTRGDRSRQRRHRAFRPQEPHPPLLAHASGFASGGIACSPRRNPRARRRESRRRCPAPAPAASTGAARTDRSSRETPARRVESRARSTAIVRSASNGTPSVPIGPSIAASRRARRGRRISRKNT